ncbi:MAG: malto-oligosyltrehalose trehalohydrolase [Jatrophihabitans sp.]|nr:MAG: malto-oligosyltrehalose trehalohydrolase [Jatrophihabitans sp.]
MQAIRVWAPNSARVRLTTAASTTDLAPGGEGWWDGPQLAPETDYAFLLGDSDEPLPDPASRWQPYGVHGSSRVYDQDAHRWRDAAWRGRPLEGAVIYELHVGTFTAGACFDSAVQHLDHLVGLGITHVEVMPVNAVNGRWNWGYDGVGWYAVHEPYGGPDGFKRFVDACHARGLAVLLDVVYNHLGPSGNYLPRFGPYLKPGRNTWGELVNLEEPAVRAFVIDNALMWLRDFHVDGLRLDAIHALADSSPTHLLAELSERVAVLGRELGRRLLLVAESDLNDPVVITARPAGYGLDGQWDDDVHHALHAALTGERQGYYCDFGPLSVLATVLTRGFLHDGTYSTFRGRLWGRPLDLRHTPGWRLVASLQNHDQVGNRAVGDRLTELVPPELLRVGAVLLLTAPFTPLLWMGEEWGARTRWPFFTSHPEPGLAEATGKGRIAEFAEHGWDVRAMIDPQDPAAYRGAMLDWTEPARPQHADLLRLYRSLIALRTAEPDLRDGDLSAIRVRFAEDERWLAVQRGRFRVLANLSGRPREIPGGGGEVVLATDRVEIAPTCVTVAARSAAIVRV